jgi:hypothetical protein
MRFGEALVLADTPWWLWLNVLGLDAPLLAISWQTLLAKCFHVYLAPAGYIVLGIACWLVYATDYVCDGLRTLPGTLAPRHEFYRAHRKAISLIIPVAAILALVLARENLSPKQFRYGLTMSVVVGGYLLATHLSPVGWRRRWPREFAVAALFTIGAFFWIWADLRSGRYRLLAPALVFSAVCWMNCAGIEYWEWRKAALRTRQPPSASARWLALHMRPTIVALTLCVLALMRLHFIPSEFAAAVALSELALFWVANRSETASANFVRIALDVALYTPLAVLTFDMLR